jgi:hypothetical protein
VDWWLCRTVPDIMLHHREKKKKPKKSKKEKEKRCSCCRKIQATYGLECRLLLSFPQVVPLLVD